MAKKDPYDTEELLSDVNKLGSGVLRTFGRRKSRGRGWHNDRYEHKLAGMGYSPRAKGKLKSNRANQSFYEYSKEEVLDEYEKAKKEGQIGLFELIKDNKNKFGSKWKLNREDYDTIPIYSRRRSWGVPSYEIRLREFRDKYYVDITEKGFKGRGTEETYTKSYDTKEKAKENALYNLVDMTYEFEDKYMKDKIEELHKED